MMVKRSLKSVFTIAVWVQLSKCIYIFNVIELAPEGTGYQHYRLEDNLLKYYPENIEAAKSRIAGAEKDMERYNVKLPPVHFYSWAAVLVYSLLYL